MYDAVYLGEDITTGESVYLEQEQRFRGTYTIGKTGSGKTTLLVNTILQDIEEGRGLCFFDTHGDAITDILKRLPAHREHDVLLLDFLDSEAIYGLTMFQCKKPGDKEEVSRVTSSIIDIFAKLFTDTGDLFKEAPTMAETLQNVIPVLLANPSMTMAEIPLLLMDDTARTKLLVPVRNPMVKTFWNSFSRWKHDQQEKLIESTRRRVNNFLSDPLILEIVGQSETTIPFRKIMDESKIVLVKLSRQHKTLTSLIGSMIVSQIAEAAFSREDTPEEERVPFFLYADEYQRFSTPTFAELLTEIRKYRVASWVCNQALGQLDHANRVAVMNANSLFAFIISGEDAKDLAPQFNTTPPEVEEVEEMEEAGVEPIRTPVQNPATWLLNHTSVNPIVNTFVTEYLRIINAGIDTQYESVNCASHEQVMPSLNRLLTSAMTGNTSSPAISVKTLGYMLSSLDAPYTPKTRYPFGYTSDNEIEASLIAVLSASLDSKEEQNASATLLTALQERVRREKLQIVTNIMTDIKRTRESTPLWKEQFQLRYPAEPWMRLDLDSVAMDTDFIVAGSRTICTILSDVTDFVDEQELTRTVERISSGEYERYSGFIRSLKETMAILAVPQEQPMDVSGAYKPVYRVRKYTPAQRSYADMENEIANQLANPEQPFTARVKLGNAEYTIQIPWFSAPDDNSEWMARRDRILEHTRQVYCSKRDVVDEAIANRQEELMRKQPFKGQTTSDDDE